jgi:hypothetical protein
MTINYELLRGDSTPATPADGTHQARLDRAKLVETRSGERLVTEWSTDQNVMWTSWNRFDPTGIEYTRELLIGLGVNLATIMDDEKLEDALIDAIGIEYTVRTTSSTGSQGDKIFTNTYVDAPVNGAQPELGSDMPADSRDLSPPEPADKPWKDDDIPF